MYQTTDTDLDRQITDEWASAYADQPLPHEWTVIDPTLAALPTLGHLLDAMGPRGALADSDRVYLALITRAQAGEEMAGRVLLQRLQPRCRQLFGTAAKRGLDDVAASAYAAAWSAVMTYPLTRTTKVRINLSMRVLNAIPDAHEEPTPIAADDLGPRIADDAPVSSTCEAARLLLWALDHDVISQDEGALLYRATLDASTSINAALTEIAAEEGVTSRAMHGRYSRVVEKITAAVLETT